MEYHSTIWWLLQTKTFFSILNVGENNYSEIPSDVEQAKLKISVRKR